MLHVVSFSDSGRCIGKAGFVRDYPSSARTVVYTVVRTDNCCFFFGNSTCSPCVEGPGNPDVDAVVELVVDRQVNAVTAVVLVRKPFSVVNAAFGELAVTFRKGIG